MIDVSQREDMPIDVEIELLPSARPRAPDLRAERGAPATTVIQPIRRRPPEAPEMNRILSVSFFLDLLMIMVLKLCLGVYFYVQAGTRKDLTFLLPIAYAVYSGVTIGYKIALVRGGTGVWFRVATLATTFVLSVGWMLYLLGVFPISAVTYFSLPHVLVTGGFAFLGDGFSARVNAAYICFKAIQLMLIPGFYASSSVGDSWTSKLILFEIIFGLGRFVCFPIFTIGLGMLSQGIRGRRDHGSLGIGIILIFLGTFLHYFWKLYAAFKYMLQYKLLAPDLADLRLSPAIKSTGMQITFIYPLLIGFCVLCWVAGVRNLVQPRLMDEADSLTIMTYPNLIRSGYRQVSDTFFKRGGSDPGIQTLTELTPCNVCLENNWNVVFSPCGHGGYCKSCVMEWLAQKTTCPTCKQEIEEMDVVVFDLESRQLMTQEVIQVNRNRRN